MALCPIVILLYSFKKYRQYESLYTLITLFFTIYSSIYYHTYNYDDVIDLHNNSEDIWRLMDHWLSSSSVVIGTMYSFKVRTPLFYVIANTTSIIILYFKITNTLAYNFFIFFMVITTILIKYRIAWKYITNYYFRTFTGLCTSGVAIYAIYIPGLDVYYLWHPIWHVCIFTTASIGYSMRHSLDNKLLQDISERESYSRAAADSI